MKKATYKPQADCPQCGGLHFGSIGCPFSESRKMPVPLVVYHANCNDGFCAAWLFHNAYPSAEFLPANYGDAPPDATGREVFILDFSWKRPEMIELTQKAAKLVCLDHHKTAAAELVDLSAGSDDGLIRFDMAKSGGRLAWEYLCRTDAAMGRLSGAQHQAPWLVDYTEDRDLWLWKLPYSKEINAALTSWPRDFSIWDALSGRNPLDGINLEGAAILRYQQQIVDSQVANAHEIDMAGYKILSVNATVLISEIAGELAKGRPFGATWFQKADGAKVWSLRSRGEDGIDVSEIAKRYGGGGHKNAAGFQN